MLVDGINNLVSASVLGTSAGDYIYNYIMNNSMIEPRNIMFKLKNKRKFYDNYDAYVTEILGEQIVLDNQNGNIHFSCIGIDKNHELKKYCINTTLIGMFNNIVWAGESKYVVDNYCLPEIIVDFRR